MNRTVDSHLKLTELHMKWGICDNSGFAPSCKSSNFGFRGHIFCLSVEGCTGLFVRLSLDYPAPSHSPACNSDGMYSGELVVTVQVKSAVTGHFFPTLTSSTTIHKIRRSKSIWERSYGEMVEASSEFDTKFDVVFIVVLRVPESDARRTEGTISNDSCLESLSESFSKLLDEGLNTDMEFQCGGLSTKAHSSVVSARSKVIASMLASGKIEGKTKVIKVQDMKPNNFKQFLRYLYTGKLDELSFDVAFSLYEAGNKYEVLSLTKKCRSFLIENLTVRNACDVLVIGDAHSDESFVEKVADFMVQNRVPKASEDWSAFCDEHPKLAIKVLNRGWKVLLK